MNSLHVYLISVTTRWCSSPDLAGLRKYLQLKMTKILKKLLLLSPSTTLLINIVTPNITSLVSQTKTGAQPTPNNVGPGAAGQREPRRTANVTGRQHPARSSLRESSVSVLRIDDWKESLKIKEVSKETPKIKEGKAATTAPGGREEQTGRKKTEKTMAVI